MGLGGQDDIWCQCCNPPQAGVKGQALVPSPPPPPSPAGMGPVTGGGSPVLVTAAPGATARLQLGMSPRCRALSQLRVPRRAGGAPLGEEQQPCREGTALGRAGEVGTPFLPGTNLGEVGRAIPVPGAALCPSEAGNQQWHLLSQAKAEARSTARPSHPAHSSSSSSSSSLTPPGLTQHSELLLQTIFPEASSHPPGHPGRCLPAPYQAGISRDGIWHLPARPGPAPPALPRAGERLLARHRPCRPCRLCWKAARQILRSWDGLERRNPLRSVPQNPRRAVLEAQELRDSARLQSEQAKNDRVMELQNCSGWKSPPRSPIPTASPSTATATT